VAELSNNKKLLKVGEGDSSSGSESAPSEDNLEAAELVKNLPTVDKTLSAALKKQQAQIKKEFEKQSNTSEPSSPAKIRRASPKKNDRERW